jgi:hypothetical protein
MPKGKRKVKKIGLRERIIRALGGVPAPKKRSGKAVNVRPYVRKSPAAKVDPAGVTTTALM